MEKYFSIISLVIRYPKIEPANEALNQVVALAGHSGLALRWHARHEHSIFRGSSAVERSARTERALVRIQPPDPYGQVGR